MTAIHVLDYFGENTIKSYIPSVWRYFLDFLALESDAHEFWSEPVFSMPQECKASIVETTTHAYSIEIAIERDSRRDNNLQSAWRYDFASNWFPDRHLVSL
jgi:hypothetical protein